ncbi:hypothetical protein PVAP13_2KG170658 [Panicum virgatum]|uniref:Uncharacterized protein n=1 Tax=Panicum virgatum TaxID=38727 RepID=A0A8T0WDP0_PANVG|nr:hypothetical protein PVAP13_2KG170658 [Panicum virgatum]
MQQPIPPQLEVAAAAAQGPDAGMGRTMRVRQPLDDTHGCCGHGAGAQDVAGGDRPRHAPLQPRTPTARRCRRAASAPCRLTPQPPRPTARRRQAAASAPLQPSRPRSSMPPQPPRPAARRRHNLHARMPPPLDASASRFSTPLQLQRHRSLRARTARCHCSFRAL